MDDLTEEQITELQHRLSALQEELTALLYNLVESTTGSPAVRKILQVDEVFPGERRHYLPDLIVLWRQETQITGLRSPKIGTVERPSPDPRTGTHVSPGFVIGHGPSVRRGQVLDGGSVLDFAPTILAQFEVSTTSHMEGKVWESMFLN